MPVVHDDCRRLACGELRLTVERSQLPLDALCGFASRRNRKRGFLFVSKVLGKHFPVRPSRMRAIHRLLATQLLDLPAPVVMIGLAETATALGQGTYEEWWRLTGGQHESLYLQTTRYHSAHRSAFGFEEAHSHATSHHLYLPDDTRQQARFAGAASLVVIDDELSTGNTVGNLLAAYRRMNPGVRELRIASITDWLSAARRSALCAEAAPARLAFANVLQGQFTFQPDVAFDCGEPVNVTGNGEVKDGYLTGNFSRFGIEGELALDFPRLQRMAQLSAGARVLVLGTGEFSYPPFLFAEWLETRGYDVTFQSTTRSPILPGGAIGDVLETVDNYWDAIPNYLYNVAPGQYDRVLIGYETQPLPPAHDLPDQLGATALYFAL